MEQIHCRTQRYEAVVPVEEYMEQCVDVAEFLPYCRQCGNYGKLWSCPDFDFDAEEYWRKYRELRIIGVKIFLPEEALQKSYTKEECQKLIDQVLWGEKRRITEELLALEKELPGSISLSAGYCLECGADNCARIQGEPCRYPERMRYSIEALGGNVGLTVTKYLKQRLLWMEEGRLPEYFILVAGLLLP